MIRALVAAAALCALAACGPAQPVLERTVREHYASGAVEPGEPDLRGAAIVDFEGCRPLNGFYQCAFTAETPAGRTAVIAWLERDGDRWRVHRIGRNALPPRQGPDRH